MSCSHSRGGWALCAGGGLGGRGRVTVPGVGGAACTHRGKRGSGGRLASAAGAEGFGAHSRGHWAATLAAREHCVLLAEQFALFGLATHTAPCIA